MTIPIDKSQSPKRRERKLEYKLSTYINFNFRD
jgi:hypothetical protein